MVTLIIFIVSSIALIIYIAYKAWHYKVDAKAKYGHILLDRRLMEHILRSLLLYTKNNIRDFLVWFTKLRFRVSAWMGNFFQNKFPKVYALFSTKHAIQIAQESENKSTSFFFRTVAEYKYKIKKTKEALHEEAKEKELEKEMENGESNG